MSPEAALAGYSKRPLAAKLGLKAGQRIAIYNAPAGYATALGELPAGVILLDESGSSLDLVHFFSDSRVELSTQFPRLKAQLAPTGKLWISWPKRAANISTDLDENRVREIGLANGLVDVKVAAIDQVWSGLQFVCRLKDR